ncbi:hypothetical protein [Candidatus Alkanophaga liquidiphilum]
MEFKYKAGGGTGADGIVHLLQGYDTNYTPATGRCLGFMDAHSPGSDVGYPVPGYGVEFDNYKNPHDDVKGRFKKLR